MDPIAFVIDEISSPTGGTEKQLLLLIRNLNRERFRPILCVLRMSDWVCKEFDLCALYDADLRSLKDPRFLPNLFRFVNFLKTERVQIVQTYFKEGNKVGVLAARLASVPAIVSARRNQGYWFGKAERRLQGIFNRWVSRFIANSEDTRRWASNAEGIPEEKISVIYNALDMRMFDSLPADSRRRYREILGIAQGITAIGIVANLRPVKCINLFIMAAKKVIMAKKETVFFIVGEGAEGNRLFAMAKEQGLEREIRFLGSRRDIPLILMAMDIGVLSSGSESFSNSIIEYMAAGLPVVCTDVGGCSEAVTDGVNGFVVPPGDPDALANGILKVIARGPSTFCEENRRLARQTFGLERIVAMYEETYLSTLKTNRMSG